MKQVDGFTYLGSITSMMKMIISNDYGRSVREKIKRICQAYYIHQKTFILKLKQMY